ncbi:hypothetical protein E2C01_064942 [Portunus trituberculatus]|uniref:Uncharacterized protein n=1 Tax=Portunus trituberculatus TaxID=210409 RepID=A0A5B7HNB1_PORTR|nr:hypothetical protein [Portunus trituberculatus]
MLITTRQTRKESKNEGANCMELNTQNGYAGNCRLISVDGAHLDLEKSNTRGAPEKRESTKEKYWCGAEWM